MAEYSDVVRRFLEENRPAQIRWDVTDSTVWAMAVPGNDVAYREERSFQWYGPFGLFRRTAVERELYAVSTSENGEELRIEVPFSISWGHRFVEGEVEYYPQLNGAWGNTHEMGAKIVKAARLEPIRVPLPEPIVTLPVPEWVTALSWDAWSPATVDTIITFVSDARRLWDKFVTAGEVLLREAQNE